MKDTLEYKILKHLKDNENGKPITLDNFHKNENLLRLKISELVKLKYITKVAELSLDSGFSVEGLRCEIRIDGIKYLNEVESQSLIFSINQETNKNNANKYKPWYKKLPINIWKLLSENKLISTLVGILILYLIKVYFGIDLKNP
jgi:hypothetical protein